MRSGEVQYRIHIFDIVRSAKTSFSFVKAAFTVSGVAVTVGHAFAPTIFTSGDVSTSYIGKKITSSGFLPDAFPESGYRRAKCQSLPGSRDRWRPGSSPRPIELRTRVVRVDDILWLNTQAFQISVEERSVRIDVQHAGNAHTQFLALLHKRNAFFRSLIPEFRGRNRGQLRFSAFTGTKIDLREQRSPRSWGISP